MEVTTKDSDLFDQNRQSKRSFGKSNSIIDEEEDYNQIPDLSNSQGHHDTLIDTPKSNRKGKKSKTISKKQSKMKNSNNNN